MVNWAARVVIRTRILPVVLVCFASNVCFAQGARGRFPAASPEGGATRQELRMQALKASQRPWLGVMVKDLPQDSAVQGALVVSVIPGSPAEKAGVKANDIIIGLADAKVASSDSFVTLVQSLQIGKEYPLMVLRDGRTISILVRPQALPMEQMAPPSARTSAEIVDIPSPRKGLTDINVLRYALINTRTGTVTFVGKYDPTYNTGPIPYADILHVVMQNPYPSFSLGPPGETLDALKQAGKLIDADIARMDDPNYCNQWAQKVADLLINDPSLEADRRRLYLNVANVMQMSLEDFRRMYDAATGKASIPDTEFMGLASKMVRGLGLTKVGDALSVLSKGGSPEELLLGMANALGLSSQFNELLLKGLTPEELRKEGIILCMSEICRQFEAPESEIENIVSSIRSGRQSVDTIIDYMGKQLTEYIGRKSGRKMLDGLVLGPGVLSKMYNLPVPKARLVFTNLPSDSLLGDIFFKSDYRLKSLSSFPDAREKVPTHLTHQEFMRKVAPPGIGPRMRSVGALGGNTLIPGEVTLRVSLEGDVVEFGDSRIRITGWIMEMLGSYDSEVADFIKETAAKYAEYLTEHYDEYAKVYPEWHKLSEAAKIIALARWAKSNGYTLSAPGESGARIAQPEYVDGFWSAAFEVDDDSQYLTFIAEGGASFDRDVGDEWIKTEQQVTLSSDISKQLAASVVFAEQALNAAITGDLESARELAEKSAMAMTGLIDLTRLPDLDGVPLPAEKASYAAATSAAINEMAQYLDSLRTAQKDLEQAEQLATVSPAEAEKLKEQATKIQDEAQAKLKQILANVSSYKSNPSLAGQAVVAIQSDSAIVGPIGAAAPPAAGQSAPSQLGQAASDEWSQKYSKLAAELEKVNKEIAVTREALLKLNASILANKNLFEEWEKSADEAFDRCVGMAGDIAIDFGITGLADRYETIYKLAKKLPGEPKDAIEKYRHMVTLIQRLKEAKALNDVAGLIARENKTEAEIYETIRDGIGQIIGLLNLDKTVPGKWWKYGTLAFDTAYNLAELYQTWKNISLLEENNQRYAEAIQRLSNKLKELVERQKEIKQQIDSGGPVENIVKQ